MELTCVGDDPATFLAAGEDGGRGGGVDWFLGAC